MLGIRNVLVGAAVCVSTCLTASAEVGLPKYERGAAFVFDNGRVERVEEVLEDRIVWSARTGRAYERSPNPVTPILSWRAGSQSGVRTILGNPDRLWPLKPGNSVGFRTVNRTIGADGKQRRSLHLWSCRSRPPEEVPTAAGTFSAIPIVCDRFSPNSMRVLERLTWHYSDQIGHYIQREARNMRTGETEMYRLYATLSPREANAVRIRAVAKEAVSYRATSRQ